MKEIEALKDFLIDENLELNTMWQELKQFLPNKRIEELGRRLNERNRICSEVMGGVERDLQEHKNRTCKEHLQVAALESEKPDSNCKKLAKEMSELFGPNDTMGPSAREEAYNEAIINIGLFAESYHASECAKCRGIKLCVGCIHENQKWHCECETCTRSSDTSDNYQPLPKSPK